MKLAWDAQGERLYETGVSNGILYPWNTVSSKYGTGVAWNGLTNISESPSGAENTDLYADNIKYLSMTSAETFGCTIEAYMYPDQFAECDGSAEIATGVVIGQQNRKSFGLCYRTEQGNDTDGNDYNHKLHLVYGCKATPSEKSYGTINDSPEAITFSWEVNATPVNVAGHKPTATVVLNGRKVGATKMAEIEAHLYGVDEFSATKTYAVGDYVIEDGTVYVCSTAVTTPAAFNESDWTEKTGITGEPTLLLPDEIAAIVGTAQG